MMMQATDGPFTDGQFWTPQTVMMRAVQQWILQSQESPQSALSIDHNPDIDRMARQRWPQIQIQEARYPKHDAQRLAAFADGQFDLVYSHQVLEHIPKPWLAGAELVRVLKPGGIGIHTTCAYNPRHGLPAFNDYYRFLPDGLAELFDGVEVLVKAARAGRVGTQRGGARCFVHGSAKTRPGPPVAARGARQTLRAEKTNLSDACLGIAHRARTLRLSAQPDAIAPCQNA